jgi:hypothetical protein
VKNSIVAAVSAIALMAGAYGQSIGSLVINTVVGSGLHGDGGPATSAQLVSPSSVLVDAAGNLYIADVAVILKMTPDGTITRFAGNQLPGFGGDRGPAAAALLGSSLTLAIDSAGAIYVADSSNHRIRQIATDGVINTVVGSGTQGFLGDNDLAATARLNFPQGVTVDASGTLYISPTPATIVSAKSNRVPSRRWLERASQDSMAMEPTHP